MNIKAITVIITCHLLLIACTAVAIGGGGAFKKNFKYEKVSRYPPDVVRVEFDNKPIYFVADDSGAHIGWCGYRGMFIGPILPFFPFFPMRGNMCNSIGFHVTLANLDKNIHIRLKYNNQVREPYRVKIYPYPQMNNNTVATTFMFVVDFESLKVADDATIIIQKDNIMMDMPFEWKTMTKFRYVP